MWFCFAIASLLLFFPSCQPATTTEEVVFNSKNIPLAGRIWQPQNIDHQTGIVILHGSEKGVREQYGGYAEALAERGHTVLTYDKRGCGRSEGNLQLASLQDLADDALAALVFLKKEKKLAKVGLLGFSEGGWVTVMAAEKSPLPDFLINISGSLTTPGEQYSFYSGIRIADFGIAADSVIRNPDSGIEMPPFLRNYDYSPMPFLSKTDIPVLMLNGGKDELLPLAAHLNLVGQLKKTNIKFRLFEQADHQLMEDGLFKKHYPEGYFDMISDFGK